MNGYCSGRGKMNYEMRENRENGKDSQPEKPIPLSCISRLS